MAEVRIETERLILRDWQDADWEAFFAGTNTPAVMEWLGGVMDEAGMARQRARLEDYTRQHGFTFWAVVRKADAELLGFCGLKRANTTGGPQGDFEIGWRLRQDAWGQGYAREAATASLDHAFRALHAPEVIALTVAGNSPSWGLMQRLDMQRRADLDFQNADVPVESSFRDIIAYSLAREDFMPGYQGQTK